MISVWVRCCITVNEEITCTCHTFHSVLHACVHHRLLLVMCPCIHGYWGVHIWLQICMHSVNVSDPTTYALTQCSLSIQPWPKTHTAPVTTLPHSATEPHSIKTIPMPYPPTITLNRWAPPTEPYKPSRHGFVCLYSISNYASSHMLQTCTSSIMLTL